VVSLIFTLVVPCPAVRRGRLPILILTLGWGGCVVAGRGVSLSIFTLGGFRL
jgi:hypothetical protein